MKAYAAVAAVGSLLWFLPPVVVAAEEKAVFAAEATKLTTGASTRLERVRAVYAFVRDEVRQVKTSYR